jgi:DNA polymerase phi
MQRSFFNFFFLNHDLQEAKDNLLGRLFAYGSLARSSRISEQWKSDKSSSIVKDFVGNMTSLEAKKRYLSEPSVSIILDLANKVCSRVEHI